MKRRPTDLPDLGALAGEVARVAAAVDALATRMVEIAEDVGELRGAMRVKDHHAPVGMVTLKEASAYADGFSVETLRLWAAVGAIRAQRRGGRWYVDVASLAAFVASKRRGAARRRYDVRF